MQQDVDQSLLVTLRYGNHVTNMDLIFLEESSLYTFLNSKLL